jgi:hypothetical protein
MDAREGSKRSFDKLRTNGNSLVLFVISLSKSFMVSLSKSFVVSLSNVQLAEVVRGELAATKAEGPIQGFARIHAPRARLPRNSRAPLAALFPFWRP